MVERVESIVVGAGVIGLAIARALALAGREVLVLEAADAIGTETSSRNSEVIHAGIYYPTDSLKARLCVRGKHLLYDYVRTRGILYRPIGKLIVATEASEVPILEGLVAKARENGVDDLEWHDRASALALEPALGCVAALLSPSTGIVDSHGLMLAFRGDAEAEGAALALNTEFRAGTPRGGGFRVEVALDGDETMTLDCGEVVNAAGLGAQVVARAIEGLDPAMIPARYLAKGNYFSLSGRAPFERLIYPVPGAASLGLHYTTDLNRRGKFGPDVEWVDQIDYRVDGARAERFYDAIRKFYPGLAAGALAPDYSGVRSKIQAPGEPAADFMILGPEVHGIAGLVTLFGIESPGLTSSMAIGDHVVNLLN